MACREILYAYSSGTGNNGSAFGGINANTPWYNLTIGLAMLIGRFLIIIPMLAVGRQPGGEEEAVPATSGTFPTHGPLFVGLLVGHSDHCRRADVFPGALAFADRGALPDARRQALLTRLAVWR